MELTLADHYYLKASECYPFCLDSTVDNLNYAISNNGEHTQSLCLLGRVYMYNLKNYDMAISCFQEAIRSDLNYPDTYKYLSLLQIWLGEYAAANKLIDYALKVKGINKASMLVMRSNIYEYQGDLKVAQTALERAKLYSIDFDTIELIDLHLTRVKGKLKVEKLSSTKRKKKLKVA